MKSETAKIIRALKRQGWTVARNNRHIVMVHELHGRITFSSSSSDPNASRSALQEIRKRGIPL